MVRQIFAGMPYQSASTTRELMDGPMRGWICGHFYPKSSPFHRHDIEICVKQLDKDFSETPHHHLCSFEFLYVISGHLIYSIESDLVDLPAGSYYMLDPCTEEYLFKVVEPALILCVRTPSIPNNKVLTSRGKN